MEFSFVRVSHGDASAVCRWNTFSIDRSAMKQWSMEVEYMTLLPFLASPTVWNIFKSTNSTFGLFATKNIYWMGTKCMPKVFLCRWISHICRFWKKENNLNCLIKLGMNIAIGDLRYNYKSIKWLCRLAQFMPLMRDSFLSNTMARAVAISPEAMHVILFSTDIINR